MAGNDVSRSLLEGQVMFRKAQLQYYYPPLEQTKVETKMQPLSEDTPHSLPLS